ncbi:MAG: DUF433 domain-containing protein [Candidatus Aminicenantes bacterium]|nr:DUF433 domain-containing protein [Candidatus Aminicenantes bacterium]
MPAKQKREFKEQYNIPMYFTAEVARLVDISRYRVHRWLEGYVFTLESGRRRQRPVVQRAWQDQAYPHYASFLDLVDLLFVKRFLDYGVSLQKLRKALDEAKEVLGTDHFARQSFFTDGKNICLEVKKRGKEKGGAILELLSGGQWVISDVIKQLAHQIDFDKTTELACRWFPAEGNRIVVLDPLISFGRPIIIGKGITTENIFDLFIAEGEATQPVCNWMDLTSEEIEAAVKFEKRLIV